MCKNDSTMNEAWSQQAITMRDSWPCRRRDARVGDGRRVRAFVRETRKVKQGERTRLSEGKSAGGKRERI